VSVGFEDIAWAIATIGSSLAARHGSEPGVAEVLARLNEQDLSARAFAGVRPARLPGCRHLPEAIGETVMTAAEVAAAIAAVEDNLAWRQNPNYSDAAMGQPGYMQNYAYAELIGPSGPFAGDDFLLGLFLLGPALRYLDHHHPAPELYWVLTGGSEWRRDDGDFAPCHADRTIWHPSWVSHATRTGQAPMLAIYAWTRDTAEFARLQGR
jgi:hypothetical protein